MNAEQRRLALLAILEKYEEMETLLACIGRSPALWDSDDDEEEIARKESLHERGFLSLDAGFFQTTPAGREALVAYINGMDESEEQ